MKRLIWIVAILCSACSGSNPTAPSPAPPITPPIPPAPTITVSGRVTASNGGQPLAGLETKLGLVSTTTDGGGMFTAQMSAAGGANPNTSLALNGPSIVPRSLLVGVGMSRNINVSAIALGGQFDLGFYRQLVRDDRDSPGLLRPLRRWMRTPNFYLKTVDEAGEAIHGPTLNIIETALRESVTWWTSGALGTPVVERGTGTREGQPGWITVKFPAEIASTYCGRAQIAVEGGWIELSYHVPPTASINCRVPGAVIAPSVVHHEVGHALGFFHTDSPNDLMWGGQWTDPNQKASARERYHAAIAYSRPVGNTDPDTDPSTAVTLQPLRVP